MLWENAAGEIIENENGEIVDCEECPCGGVSVECCEAPIPETLTVTVDTSFPPTPAGCEEYEGLTFPITYDPNHDYTSGTGAWVGSAQANGDTFSLRLFCHNSQWQIDISCDDFASIETVNVNSVTCSPFEATGGPAGFALSCPNSGCFYLKDFTITE